MGELSFEGDLDKLMPILEAKFVNLDAGVGKVSEGLSSWSTLINTPRALPLHVRALVRG